MQMAKTRRRDPAPLRYNQVCLRRLKVATRTPGSILKPL